MRRINPYDVAVATLAVIAGFALVIGFIIALPDAIPQHYSAGVTMP